MNEMTTEARQKLGTYFRETVAEKENKPQIALASERFRAIDLSCRACGAMAMGAGLGFPVGDLILRFPPPTSDLRAQSVWKSMLVLETRVWEAGAIESLKLDEIEIGPSNESVRCCMRAIQEKWYEVADNEH